MSEEWHIDTNLEMKNEAKVIERLKPLSKPLQTEGAESIEYSVVVPVRDEAGNIVSLVDELNSVMSTLVGSPRYEIIFVDDCSSDASAEEIMSVAHSCARLRMISFSSPCGQSQALIIGVQLAKGPWIITLDGDGQNDPADIPKLIDIRNNSEGEVGKCLFVGHRLLRKDSLIKRYASWLANDIRGWLLRDAVPDSGCGLKLFRRDAFLALPRFDALHRFLPVFFLRAGGRTVSVEVSHRLRCHGVSKYGILKRFLLCLVDLIGVMWLMHRHTRPEPIVSSFEDLVRDKSDR